MVAALVGRHGIPRQHSAELIADAEVVCGCEHQLAARRGIALAEELVAVGGITLAVVVWQQTLEHVGGGCTCAQVLSRYVPVCRQGAVAVVPSHLCVGGFAVSVSCVCVKVGGALQQSHDNKLPLAAELQLCRSVGNAHRGACRQIYAVEIFRHIIIYTHHELAVGTAAERVASRIAERHLHILAQAVVGTVVAGSRSGDSRLYAFHLNPREGNAVGQCGEQALRAVFLGEGHSPVAPRLSHGPLRREMLSAHD